MPRQASAPAAARSLISSRPAARGPPAQMRPTMSGVVERRWHTPTPTTVALLPLKPRAREFSSFLFYRFEFSIGVKRRVRVLMTDKTREYFLGSSHQNRFQLAHRSARRLNSRLGYLAAAHSQHVERGVRVQLSFDDSAANRRSYAESPVWQFSVEWRRRRRR